MSFIIREDPDVPRGTVSISPTSVEPDGGCRRTRPGEKADHLSVRVNPADTVYREGIETIDGERLTGFFHPSPVRYQMWIENGSLTIEAR